MKTGLRKKKTKKKHSPKKQEVIAQSEASCAKNTETLTTLRKLLCRLKCCKPILELVLFLYVAIFSSIEKSNAYSFCQALKNKIKIFCIIFRFILEHTNIENDSKPR